MDDRALIQINQILERVCCVVLSVLFVCLSCLKSSPTIMVRPAPHPLTLCRAGCVCPTCTAYMTAHISHISHTAHISPVEAHFVRGAPVSASAATFPTYQQTSGMGGVSMVRSTSVPVLTYAEHAEFTASMRSMRSLRSLQGEPRASRQRPALAGVFDMDERNSHIDENSSHTDVEMREVPLPVSPNEHLQLPANGTPPRDRSYLPTYAYDCTPRTSRPPAPAQPRTASPSPARRPPVSVSTLSRAAALRTQLRVRDDLEDGCRVR